MRLNRREATKEKQEEMISMALRPAARKRPAVNAAPRSAVVQSDKEVGTGGGFTTRLSSVAQEILAGTCRPLFARAPGSLRGSGGAVGPAGMVGARALPFLVVAGTHLAVGPWWAVTLVSISVGIVGAKGWFIVLHRREHRINGWCIQGFITGAPLAAAILLVLLHVPAEVFLDAMAPGLLVAMAVGRVGCFFAGCCGD